MNALLERIPITRGPRYVLIAALLLPIFAVAGFDLVHGVPMAVVKESKPTADRLLQGTFQRGVDKRFETESDAMRIVRPYWNEAMLGLFLETPSKITAGYDDFLFYTASLRRNRRWEVVRPIDHLERLRGWLPDDVRTVVLVMPSKWRVYEEKLRSPAIPKAQRRTYGRAREEMIALGYEAPDVLAILLDEKRSQPDRLLYSPGDTHLTQWGFYRLVERLGPELFGEDLASVSARLAALDVDPNYEFYGELLDVLQVRPTSWVGAPRWFAEPAYLAPALGNGPGEVLLIGDSFVNVQEQILPRLLQAASGMAVDRSPSTPLGVERFDLAEAAVAPYRQSLPKVLIAIYSERRF